MTFRESVVRAAAHSCVELLESRSLLSASVLQPHNLIDSNSALKQARVSTIDNGASYWRPRIGENAVTRAKGLTPSYLKASSYRAFALDTTLIEPTLHAAPLEYSTQDFANSNFISLPRPDGTVMQFAFQQSSVMAPELAAEFSDIHTYAGTAVDGSGATVRFDVTPAGFHAQVLEAGSTWYIDPYYHLDQSIYASYWRKDMQKSAADLARQADVVHDDDLTGTDAAVASALTPVDPVTSNLTSGTQLRTYRLAVAATGEYTAFHGGSVASGQAAIVTAINRVNQLYEQDLSIRLTLVGNNSTLVYTNAGSDPYTNTDGEAMLDQNQSTITSKIGSGNYDIGHVFSTGGGGIAGLGVVGASSAKAEGVTGSNSPTGDAFWIDYVAHEMGHQFNGNHTFNTSQDPNINNGTAYEPGSGSTIMAYAGIEGTENIQSSSDPFFHWISQQEIVNFVDRTTSNNYGVIMTNVGTRTATNNTLPTVNGGLDYTIPTGTPFALTATGSDANGDTLTYDWEEADLGASRLLTDADNGASPLFRSYPAVTNPTRLFPRLASILSSANNTSAPSGGGLIERLPTVARNAMKFRVTVRDNRAGGGGINTDDVSIKVVNTTAFSVSTGNAATTWAAGSAQTIAWNAGGTTANGINTANVKISLSTDDGVTFPYVLLVSTPNDGTESVTIPAGLAASANGRIKIEAVGNIFFDINNAKIAITAAAGDTTPPTMTGNTFNFTTNQSNSVVFSESVSPSITNTANFTVQNLTAGTTVPAGTVTSTFNTGTNTATIGYTSLLADGNYRITFSNITDTAGNALSGTNTVDFFVLAGDANRDRFVDAADQAILTTNLNQSGKNFTQGDFDYNATVNSADQTILNNSLKRWLPVIGSTALPATSGIDLMTLKRETSTVTDVINNGTLQYRVYTGGLTALSFSGGNSDDALTLDYSNGVPFPGITFAYDGGAGADTLAIVGQLSATDTATFNASNVVVNGTTVTDTTNEARTYSGQNGSDVVTVNGGPVLQFPITQSVQSLSLAGGKARINQGAAVVLTTKSILVTGAGAIDINDNDLIIDYTGSSNPFSAVLNLVKSGLTSLGGGGNGITSTSANTNYRPGTTLAVVDNGGVDAGFGSFPGATALPLASVIVRYTWYGDANLTGTVDGTDYAIVDSGFAGSDASWARGDFDYTSFVNFTDYALVDTGFASATAVL